MQRGQYIACYLVECYHPGEPRLVYMVEKNRETGKEY